MYTSEHKAHTPVIPLAEYLKPMPKSFAISRDIVVSYHCLQNTVKPLASDAPNRNTEMFLSRFAVVFAQSIEAMC